MSYNGWTNYETWDVHLHMSNDRPQQDFWGEVAKVCYMAAVPDGTFTQDERAVLDMADRIKEEHTSAAEDMLEAANYEIGPFADLLRGALSEVNWHEIAKHWIEAAKQEVEV